MLHELDRMTYKEVEEYLASGKGMIILPVGATETHATHGPLGTDTFAATLVSRKVAEKLGAILAPSLPYGMSDDQIDFRGTITFSPRMLSKVIKEIVGNFIRDGYLLVLVISGHRSNDWPCITGLMEARGESNSHLLYMSYQDANRGRLVQVLGPENAGKITEIDQKYGADGHAGSMELSLAMAYSPGCVRLEKRSIPDRTLPDALRSMPFRSVMFIEEWMPSDGFMGDPSLCSEELGHRIAENTSTYIAEKVRDYLRVFGGRKRRTPPPISLK